MSGQDMVRFIMRDILRKTVMGSLAALVFLACAGIAHARWEIEYTDFLINAMRRQGHSVPKRVGSYSKRAECEEARRRAIIQSGDPSLEMHMKCVGFDEPSHQTLPVPSQQHPGRAPHGDSGYRERQEQSEQERQRKEEQETAERERSEAFEREKEKLLKAFKGGSSTGITGPETGTTGLPLKGSGNSQATGLKPYDPAIKEETGPQTGTTGLPLKGSGTSQPTASKPYDPAIRERTMKAIKELNCSAYWALDAAGAALKGDFDKARRSGEFSAQAKGGGTASGCPEIKVYVPDAPPPVEMNPQANLYKHILWQTEILVPAIIETQKNIQDTKNRIEKTGKDIVVKQDRIKWLDKNIDHPRLRNPRIQKEEAEKELDELKKQALELQKVADQLNKTADEQRGKVVELQGIYQFVTENPQQAEELAKKVR